MVWWRKANNDTLACHKVPAVGNVFPRFSISSKGSISESLGGDEHWREREGENQSMNSSEQRHERL